jgi:hypothetical protein
VLLLIRVILNADQVVAEVVEDVGDLGGALGITRCRIEEETELKIVAIVGHVYPPKLPLERGAQVSPSALKKPDKEFNEQKAWLKRLACLCFSYQMPT